MKIEPSETKIIGGYTLTAGEYIPDEAYRRIDYLCKNYLIFIKTDWSGWEWLYKDPSDGRFWEMIRPQGAYHGGGPPQLQWLPEDEAKTKYNLS